MRFRGKRYPGPVVERQLWPGRRVRDKIAHRTVHQGKQIPKATGLKREKSQIS